MTLDILGARVHLVERGSGSPVLFLHGNPDSADLWSDVIARMQARHRCLAPDLPGFGRSTAPAQFDCSMVNLARFVDELVDRCGVAEPLPVVAHDFGGIYAVAWAVRHPEKVACLVLSNTIFSSAYRWHFWARVWRTPLVGELSMLLMNEWMFRRELERGSRKLDSAHLRRTYELVTPEMKRIVLRHYRAASPENFAGWEDRLLEIAGELPVLVLWGDYDPYIPVRFAEQLGARRVRHFPDCGHWLPAEAPDAIAEEALAFIVGCRQREMRTPATGARSVPAS